VIEALHQHNIGVDRQMTDLEVNMGCAAEVRLDGLTDRVVT
jgi:hypothetical protein